MRFRISAEVNVINEESLVEYARRRFLACWADELDNMVVGGESLVERALLEAVFFSNENPSPDEWGVEFMTGEVEEIEDVSNERPSYLYKGIE